MKKRLICFILVVILIMPCLSGCDRAGGDPAGSSHNSSDTTDIGTPDITEYNIISVEDYTDKTTAAFLSQLTGFLSGYEFVRNSDGSPRVALPDSWFELLNGPYAGNKAHKTNSDTLVPNEKTGILEPWSDDDYSIDILNQYLLRDMYGKYGTIVSKVITDGWVKYDVYDLGGGATKGGAKQLMKSYNLLPPFTGMAEYGNIYSWCGEPYIANETLGMSAAGMPDVASSLTEIFGSVTGEYDNVMWARFFSAMYSMAYFTDDIVSLINSAKVVFPQGSWQKQVIDKVFELKERFPDDWRRAVTYADRECFRAQYATTDKMGETSINCSFILIGLLYGNGDFLETCKIVSLAGHGGDSTTPVALGIVGIINGMKNLPPEVNKILWRDGEGIIVNRPANLNYAMYSAGLPATFKIADIIEMYRSNFENILLENGGKILDGKYYIPVSRLRGSDTVVIANGDFESGTLDNFSVKNGSGVEITNIAHTGKYAAKLTGGETERCIYTVCSGLETGTKYRVTAFVLATANTAAYLYAAGSDSDFVYTSVYDQKGFVKRNLVFTAVSESMEIGLILSGGLSEFKYAAIDNIYVERVSETPLTGDIALSGSNKSGAGEYTGKLSFKAEGTGREAYLKISFSNYTGKIIFAPITLNGVSYAAAPLYKTGKAAYSSGKAADAVYIPIVLNGGENNVTLDFGADTVIIRSAEIVNITDTW